MVTQDTPLAMFAFLSFLVGFGMKAGMFPLHVWLPDAHPVAPSPASALLSGIMLKTGAYGLLRVMFHVFTPELMRDTRSTTILATWALSPFCWGQRWPSPRTT
jgi:multicomponent Na+:H+ antiporter subunit D